jgi:glycosyltransferase involved in cell wall biosynthesis
MQAISSAPMLSIGLPVYNGESFLAPVIDSILGQDFGNFELILSDKASDVNTESICRAYARQDRRIRYLRQRPNLGTAQNFNLVAVQARSPFFKWAAHDDICPPFLSRCLEMLIRTCDAAVSYRVCACLLADGREDGHYPLDIAFDADEPHLRLQQHITTPHYCISVFGIMRTSLLRQTRGLGAYVSSDRVLLAELLLRGKTIQIPDFLFLRRDHPQTSVEQYPDDQERIAWFDPGLDGTPSCPVHRLVRGYAQAIVDAPLSDMEKARCRRVLGHWVSSGSNYRGRPVRELLSREQQRIGEFPGEGDTRYPRP